MMTLVEREKFEIVDKIYNRKRRIYQYIGVCLDCGCSFRISCGVYDNPDVDVKCFGYCEEDPNNLGVKGKYVHDFRKKSNKTRCSCGLPIFDKRDKCTSCLAKDTPSQEYKKLNPSVRRRSNIKEEISQQYQITP